jgi:adenylate kinase family enzyme
MKKHVKKFFRKLNKKWQRVKVYALVGATGTGKSFRARLIMEKYDIPLMVDDGLLIKDQSVLAGKSAKREKNRITAVKRAILEDLDHARALREALAEEDFPAILLIGTSDRMVKVISERLHLHDPDQIIDINDVATQEEIAEALYSRRIEGKHVIPVPVIEVKNDPEHQILESIQFFLKSHPLFFWRDRKVEKTIVQAQYSRRGKLSLSDTALSQMAMHAVHEFDARVQIEKIKIESSDPYYEVIIRLSIPYGMSIPDTLVRLHEYIITRIERYSGIHLRRLDLDVSTVRKDI